MTKSNNNEGWVEVDVDAASEKRIKDTPLTTKNVEDSEDNGFETSFEDDAIESNDEVYTEEDEVHSLDYEEDEEGFEELEDAPVVVASEEERKKEAPKKDLPRSEKRIKTLIEKLKTVSQERDDLLVQQEIKYQNEILKLQAQLRNQSSDLADISVQAAEKRVLTARERLRAAKENMDTDLELEALEELQEAKIAKIRADELATKTPKKGEKDEVPQQINPAVIKAQRNLNAWVQANQQFVNDPRLAAVVRAVATNVESEGWTPDMVDYYTEVNTRINKHLEGLGVTTIKTKHFYVDEEEGLYDTPDNDEEEETPEPVIKKRPVMNPISTNTPKQTSTSTKNRTRISLSPEEVKNARALGVSPESLLKQKAYERKISQERKLIQGWNEVYIPTKR
jgi:hypothetical protein